MLNLDQYQMQTARISAMSSGKIYKYEYLMGEEVLPPNQSRLIEQAKFVFAYNSRL